MRWLRCALLLVVATVAAVGLSAAQAAVAPTVATTSPAGGAAGIATDAQVSATFSDSIDPATISASTFTLAAAGASAPVVATVAYDAATRTATLTPGGALAKGTTYTASLASTIADTAGTTLTAAHAWTFTTAAPPPPIAPPSVKSTSPAANANAIVLGASVAAVFSTGIDPATITSSSFTLTAQGATTPIAATVTYDAASTSATLAPGAPLAAGTTYTAALAATISSSAGVSLPATSWTFATVDAPAVAAAVPASASTGIATDAQVRATFSAAMNAATITADSFTLRARGAAAQVVASVAYDAATSTAILTPGGPLAAGTTYTVSLAGTVSSAAGIALIATRWEFTTSAGGLSPPGTTTSAGLVTAAAVGTAAAAATPVVASVFPADGQLYLPQSTTVSATFDVSMDPSTVTTASFTLVQQGTTTPVAATVAYVDATKTAVLTPAAGLLQDTWYVATLDPTMASAAGMPLATARTWSFMADSPPTAPLGITGIALDGKVELAWQPVTGTVPPVDGYSVYRGTSPTTVTTLVTPAGFNATSFTDATAVNGTTYYYVVRARALSVESVDSLVVAATPGARSCTTGNPVVLENCAPGSNGWKLIGADSVASGGIAGFATAASVNKGGSVDLKVDGAAGGTYSMQVYRIGYYNGAGGRLFSTVRGIAGKAQPACVTDAGTGLYDCANWSTSVTLTTTASWPSGVYLLHLIRDNAARSDTQVVLAVRDDASTSSVLYGLPVSTYQAYNNYGGKSLYTFNSAGASTVAGTPRAVKVSFDRPFAQVLDRSLRDWFTRADYQWVYWLEREGYDASYISDTDLETRGLGTHKAYVMGAHDEYWSPSMRAALENGRTAGVGLLVSGANAVYWKIRFENGAGGTNRVEVDYKNIEGSAAAADPVAQTTTWRDPTSRPSQAAVDNPENALLGQMYVGDNASSSFPLVVGAAEGKDPVYRNTGLDNQPAGSSTSIGVGLVGWEWDARVGNGREPASVKTLATSPVNGNLVQGNGSNTILGSTSSNVTKYVAASGATVFATGSNDWGRGLAVDGDDAGEPNQTIQQITTNVLVDMGAPPATPAAGVVVAGATTPRPAAPTGLATPTQALDRVSLTWSAVTGAAGYYVYRSNVPRSGGEPLGTLLDAVPVTATSFTDVPLDPATVYYYVVTSVKGGLQSTASNELEVATTGAAAGAIRINAGGPAYTSGLNTWLADTDFAGGGTHDTTAAISGTTDQALFQDERFGAFTYAIPVVNGTYSIRFRMAETFFAAPCAGRRVFSLDIVDTPGPADIKDLDVCNAVGPNAAFTKTITNVAITDGIVDIKAIRGVADDPLVSAIDIIPAGAPNAGTLGDTPAGSPPPTSAPTVVSQTPAAGATGVAVGVSPTATFSRAMNAATITTGSFTVTPTGSTTTVAAAVTYDSTTNTATLTPAAPLATGVTYVARVAGTVADTNGTLLGTAVSWSFTTASPACPCTLFPSTLQPELGGVSTANGRAGGPWSLEFGVKINVDRPMRLTAVRFYKDAQETGAHTMTVWTANGIALATVPFSPANEIGSGWVQQPLLVPLGLEPNVTYVVSLGVNAFYGRTLNGLAAEVISGPLHSVVDGLNGMFADTAGTFPTQSFSSTNYFVDVQVSADAPGASPTVISTTPAPNAGDVPRTNPVTATLSRALDPLSVDTTTFTLLSPAGTVVPAAVGYDTATRTVRLTPSQTLDPAATYTAQLTTGIRAGDGTALAAPVTWRFTTRNDAPTIVARTPAAGAAGVSTAIAPTLTFSETMTASTINATTVTLSLFGGAAIPAAVAYDAVTRTATLTPAAPLNEGSVYTMRVDGSVQSAVGTPIGTAASWTFTVAGCPCTLFPPTLQPAGQGISTANADGAGSTSLEFGVKITVDSPRRLSAIRFYRDPAETGSHTGRIWSADGRLLASVPFTNEGAGGGWKEQALPSPVLLQADTVYVISANANTSWGRTLVGLETRIDSGPLHSVADGKNGAFAGAAGIFPTQSFSATNYFVDAVIVNDGTPAAALATAVAPTSNAVVVSRTTAVSATFNRPLNPLSVTAQTVTLSAAGALPVAASVGYDDSTRTVTLTPSAPLEPSTTYTATLSTAVETADHVPLVSPVTWRFTTDSAPPAVTARTPVDGALGVPVTVTPTATFSTPMDPTTFSDISFSVKLATGLPIAGTVTLDATRRIAAFLPAVPLGNAHQYTATISAVKSADGKPLPAPVTWTFTTQGAAPAVIVTTPANAATGVGLLATASATFSAPMAAATLTPLTFTLTKSGDTSPVAASVTLDATGTTATLTPARPLAAGAAYTARIDGSVQSADSGVLGTPVAWSFQTVVDTTPPDTTITAGPSAPTNVTSATFAFTSTEANSTFACSLDAAAFTACSSGILYAGPLTDGLHTFQVQATDLAGNADPTPASSTWTVDTQAPVVTFTVKPSSPTNNTTAAFSFGADTAATFVCALDGALPVNCDTGSFSRTVAAGVHGFTVRATDAAGNGATASHSWTVDTTRPMVTISSGPGSPTNRTIAQFTFAADKAGSTFECKLDTGAAASCSSPTGLFSGLAAGAHTFTLTATDPAGNTGTTSYDWVIDTAAPNVTLTSTPANPTNDTSAGFAFTSSKLGSSFSCQLDGGVIGPCNSPVSYPGLAAGSHTFSVSAIDPVGNTGSASYTWTIDTTAPAVSITAGKPASPTKVTSASFTFTAEAGATVDCALDGSAFAACASPKAYSALADGSHTFQVRATDAAGNSAIASHTWTVDTAAPAVSITGGRPASPTKVTSASFTFTAEAGATVDCALDGSAFAACTSPKAYSALADGSHTFQVRATDAAGNSAIASHTWTVDTTAPAVSITAGKPASPTKVTSANFAFTAEAGTTTDCALDGSVFASCSSPKAYTALADGSHTFQVRATDAAGNAAIASHTWTVDTTAPAVSITGGRPASPTKVTTASFTFTAEAGATVDCALDGSAFAACTSPKAYSALADGSHTFQVRATDGAGNSAAVSHVWTVDTASPVVTLVTKPANPTNATTAGFSFTSSKTGSTFQCQLDSGASAACNTGSFSAAVAAGGHTVTVTAIDPAGNTGTAAYTWTVDTTAPDSIITASPASPTTTTGASFSFTSDDAAAATFACSLDSAAFSPCTSPQSYAALALGSHTFTVRAMDAAGNVDATPASVTWLIGTSPTVTAKDPADSATGVSPGTAPLGPPIKATFSRAMDATTITSSSYTLTPQTGAALAATVTVDSATSTATLTPSAVLGSDTLYTAKLDATIKAADGLPLAAAVSWTFRTAVVAPPPTVTFAAANTQSIVEGTAAATQYTYAFTIANAATVVSVTPRCANPAQAPALGTLVAGSLTFTSTGGSFKCTFVTADGGAAKVAQVGVTVKRDDNVTGDATQNVTIANASPVVTITSPPVGSVYTVGGTVIVNSTFTDPGGTYDGSYTCTINWGDTSPNTVLTVAAPGACNASHAWKGKTTKFTVTVTDKDGGTTTVTRAVTVF